MHRERAASSTVAALVLCAIATTTLAQQIDWRLQDANRLYRDGQAFRTGYDWVESHAPGDPAIPGAVPTAEEFLKRSLRANDLKDLPDNPSERPSREGIFRYEKTFWEPLQQSYSKDYLRNPAAHGFKGKLQLKLTDAQPGEMCTWSVTSGASTDSRVSACGELSGPLQVALKTSSGPQTMPSKVTVATSAGRAQVAEVHPRHIIILGFGDSYSSGEGSPDRPAAWKDVKEPDDFSTFWASPADRWLERPARWWDRNCHRSLYSWQALAANRLVADQHSRTAVSFVGFACSGDEVLDGLLNPRVNPPYGGSKVYSGQGESQDERRTLPMSQMNNAVHALCLNEPGPGQSHIVSNRTIYVLSCPNSLRPDVILLGIGGNDIGFSKVIVDMFLPREARGSGVKKALSQKALNAVRVLAQARAPAQAEKEARALPSLYQDVNDVLTKTWKLPEGERRVIFANYPNPMPDRESKDYVLDDTVVYDRCVNRKREKTEGTRISQCRVLYNHLVMAQVASSRWPGLVPDILPSEQQGIKKLRSALQKGVQPLCDSEWRCVSAARIDHSALNAYYPGEPDPGNLARAKTDPTFFHDKFHRFPAESGMPDWHMRRALSSWDAYVHPLHNERFLLTMNDAVFVSGATSNCRLGSGRAPAQVSEGYENLPEPKRCVLDLTEMLKGSAHLTLFAHARYADAAFPEMRKILAPQLNSAPDATAQSNAAPATR